MRQRIAVLRKLRNQKVHNHLFPRIRFIDLFNAISSSKPVRLSTHNVPQQAASRLSARLVSQNPTSGRREFPSGFGGFQHGWLKLAAVTCAQGQRRYFSHVADTTSMLPPVRRGLRKLQSPIDNPQSEGAVVKEPEENQNHTSAYFPNSYREFGERRSSPCLVKPVSSTEFEAFRPKVDLSYHDVRSREMKQVIQSGTVTTGAPATAFRANSGIRRILNHYMDQIEPLLVGKDRVFEERNDIDRRLRKVFTSQALKQMHDRGIGVEDIASWSWMFTASTTALSTRRFASLAALRRTKKHTVLPHFLILQLLRAEHIDSPSLALLISEVEADLETENNWNPEAGAILLIRLLRHARMTNSSFYGQIADLAPKVVQIESRGNEHQHVRRLTHFYNRFLSLLALPLTRHPFLSVDAQQRAQLKIARSMMESPLKISLNREGYRALARVQLMHKKTTEEQRWSSVKGSSWPPWRRDELGIDARTQYLGQQSRTAKVIKRLLEAGYGPDSVEHEAQILAGWDIDRSPTIQMRRLTKRRPLSWVRNFFADHNTSQPEVDHYVWAARVAATRSIREAWVCFYSYMQATMSAKRQLRVYHDMFHKLFARIQHTEPKHLPSAGDGREVYPDPVSLRDLVYVHKEPPSVDELYAQMLQDGIQPAGRLLASLLDNAESLRRGFQYINDSTLGDVKKDILLHPEKYPSYFIRNMFSTLPDYLLASYIALLARTPDSDGIELFPPGSKSVEEHGLPPNHAVKPLPYAMMHMRIWTPSYMPAYHAILEGICVQAKARRLKDHRAASRQYAYFELWSMAKEMLNQIRSQNLLSDLVCYRKMIILFRNTMIRAPAHFKSNALSFAEITMIVKTCFARAIGGFMKNKSMKLPEMSIDNGLQPYWKDIEVLLILLGFDRDFDAIIDLLNWLRDQGSNLLCMDTGGYKMQRLACAARVALEGSWTDDRSIRADEHSIQKAKEVIDQWGWPENVDVEEYTTHHRAWFESMRTISHSPS